MEVEEFMSVSPHSRARAGSFKLGRIFVRIGPETGLVKFFSTNLKSLFGDGEGRGSRA